MSTLASSITTPARHRYEGRLGRLGGKIRLALVAVVGRAAYSFGLKDRLFALEKAMRTQVVGGLGVAQADFLAIHQDAGSQFAKLVARGCLLPVEHLHQLTLNFVVLLQDILGECLGREHFVLQLDQRRGDGRFFGEFPSRSAEIEGCGKNGEACGDGGSIHARTLANGRIATTKKEAAK